MTFASNYAMFFCAVITSSTSPPSSSISTQQCCDTINVVTTAVVEVSSATEKTPTYITGILSPSQLDTINTYHISLEKTLPLATSSILSVVATPVASTATSPHNYNDDRYGV